MHTQIAREQMVEQQVRAWEVLDERVLATLRAVPRELFVGEHWQELAFADCELPLPCGKRMLRPMVVGRLLQALALRSGEQLLEVGTGSGYVSACMAHLGARVRTLELHPEIALLARANLARYSGGAPVEVIEADGMGLAEQSGYDVIVLTASLPIYETRFEQALRPGGRLFVVIGMGDSQRACIIRRSGEHAWTNLPLFETCIEALEGAPRPPTFDF
jgi:protein-L-isoaspartate(D-aspartate) O-methyltransferase